MIRKALLSMSLISVGVCFATPLTPEEALSRVGLQDPIGNTRSIASVKPLMAVDTRIGEPALYVFDRNDSRGYMIVSADDAVTPLLGYSDDNGFDADNLPPALQSWMDQYAEQIAYIRENLPTAGSNQFTGVTLPNWPAIAPLVKTKWGQQTPFNNICPDFNNTKSATGCVATAMAQVMNYFQYPAKGQGKISFKSNDVVGNLSLDFSELTFEWNNMIDSYNGSYTPQQAYAVATLMKAAGYSVRMSYTNNYSGALSGLIPGALIQYFNYDKGIRYENRDRYTYTEWATKIYDNLKNIGPVIYDGYSFSNTGHSFVCDGYENGYFHFNWGWNGSSNGYFLLDALNPPSLGTGGGDGGYNYLQNVVFGVKPATEGSTSVEQDSIIAYGSIVGLMNSDNELTTEFDGGSVLGWAYQGASQMTINIGLGLVPADYPSESPVYVVSTNEHNNNLLLLPGEYLPNDTYDRYGRPISLRPTYPLSDLNLTSGVKYKAIASAQNCATGEWMEVAHDVGSYNYFYITKTGSGNSPQDYVIENFTIMGFTCDALALKSDLSFNIAVEVSTTITNNNDTELSRGVTLVLLNDKGEMEFKGSTSLVTLAPGQSTTLDWTTTLTSLKDDTNIRRDTEFYMGLFDPYTETLYYKSAEPVVMSPYPGTPTISVTVNIDNATKEGTNYIVENSTDFDVTSTVKCTRNTFSIPLTLWLAEFSNGTYWKILSFPYEPEIINRNETATFTSNVNFPDAVVGEKYYLGLYYEDTDGKGKLEGVISFIARSNEEAGIDSVVADTDEIAIIKVMDQLLILGNEAGIASVEIYSLNGMKLSPEVVNDGNKAQVNLSSLGKGVIVVTVTDTKGNRKSQKIML